MKPLYDVIRPPPPPRRRVEPFDERHPLIHGITAAVLMTALFGMLIWGGAVLNEVMG